MLLILVLVGGVLGLGCYFLIIPNIFRVARQKREALATFGLIGTQDIRQIINISQKYNIKDIKYDSSLKHFQESEELFAKNQDNSGGPRPATILNAEATPGIQTTNQQLAGQTEIAIHEGKEQTEQIIEQASEKEKKEKKRDHLKTSE